MKYSEDHRKLVKVASLYYQEGWTQAEIAKKMQISRPMISKILQAAREKGIVRIYLDDETAHSTELARQIETKFQLQDVIVAPNNDVVDPKQAVAEAAAGYLLTQLRPQLKIGLTWGTTLAAVINEIPFQNYPDMQVCPLVGGVSSEHLYYDTNHLTFRLAERLQADCHYFYAPALAESQILADTLRSSQMLQRAMKAAKSVDLALIGLGNPLANSTWQTLGYWQDPSNFADKGIVGDVAASLFDKNGQTVNNEISQRMLGLKVEELTEIPQVVVVASGKNKADSLWPLLVAQRCTTIVIDEALAEEIVKKAGR